MVVHAMTLLTTFLAPLTGLAQESCPNIIMILSEVSEMGPQHISYWRYLTRWARQYAIRDNDWKLVSPDGKQYALYKLNEDKGEKNDLTSANPDIARRLLEDLNVWMKDLPERPKWIDKLAGE